MSIISAGDSRLGDFIRIKHGYAFKSKYFSSEGPYIVLTPGNFHDEGGFKHKGDKEKYYIGEVPVDFILKEGSLLVAMTEQAEGLLGSTAIVPGDKVYLHNQRLGLIEVLNQDQIDKKFLYYLFNHRRVRDQIRASASGTKVRHTSPSRIYEVEFLRPPLQSQRRIASILSAYDDLIENNTQRIAILEEMARRIYQEWFVNFRFPGNEKVKMVDSELGKIPKGWEATCLKDVAVNFDRQRKPLSKMQRAEMQGEYPYYGAAKILDYVNDYLFDGRYLLMAEDGSVIDQEGYPVLQLVDAKFWVNNHTHILQGTNLASLEFLYLHLNQFPISGYITGAAQPKITQTNMHRIPVPVAPKKLRDHFQSVVEPLIDLVLTLGRMNINLRTQRDLLLPKLISGEIDVSELPNPSTEAAAA